MHTIIIALFSDRIDADTAIDELKANDIPVKDMSLIMREGSYVDTNARSTADNIASGAAGGAATGGVLGGIAGLLVGLGALTIPGIGALFIAGPIATALGLTGAAAVTASGAITGALAGGLVGSLVGLGVPEEDARQYEERIKAGEILLAIPATDRDMDKVKTILTDNQAQSIRTMHLSDKQLAHT
ncbi:MAG: low temperature-induced protein [Candidatus Abawacabacteria bacterium]|nr:low temperature-induced protein [Candidatus Abawacabacteria bacterium]